MEFETFRNIGSFEIKNLTQNEPSCFNSEVRIEKFKITIEPVEESKEVYAERLQKMWDECDNHHHWQPLKNTAKQMGVELQGSAGTKRKK